MGAIKLFSTDAKAGMAHEYHLRYGLAHIQYDYKDYQGNDRQTSIRVGELDQMYASAQDQAYLDELDKEGKIAHLNQYASAEGIKNHSSAAEVDEHVQKSAITQVGTHNLDPAMLLGEMYSVLQEARHELRDKGHPHGGEVENYVAGLRITDGAIESDKEVSTTLTAEEFRDIAAHMRGEEVSNPDAIEAKIAEIRDVVGYKQEKEAAVTPVEDRGTIGKQPAIGR